MVALVAKRENDATKYQNNHAGATCDARRDRGKLLALQKGMIERGANEYHIRIGSD